MDKIVIIATGGTIASRRNLNTSKLSSGVIAGQELIDLIPDLGPDVTVEVKNLFGVPSSFLDLTKMLELAKRIEQHLGAPDVKGVVVTHGTDTLEESVYLADLVVSSDKPVVFTGSQRGPLELGSDGISNLRDAIRVAACDRSRDKGVLVVFNEEIHPAAHVVKTDAYKLETFKSVLTGPIGYVDEKNVHYHSVPIRKPHFSIQEIGARVDLIKIVAGMDGSFITSAIERGVDGIVIEGFGRGHVPPLMVPAIKDAIAAGITVVVTSRCGKGFVRDVYDFEGGMSDLLAKGVIAAAGLPGTKARILLVVVLSQTRNVDDIRSHFSPAQ